MVDRELELTALVEAPRLGRFWHVSLPLAWRARDQRAMMMWARG